MSKKIGTFWSVLDLLNSTTGAAFLALPYQVLVIGQTNANLLVLIFLLLTAVSLWIISEVKLKTLEISIKNTTSLPELGNYLEKYGGFVLSGVYNFAVVASMFGTVCAFTVIGKTLFSSMVLYAAPATTVNIDGIFVAVYSVLVYPFCIIKNISGQRILSLISVVCLLYVTILVIIRGSQGLDAQPSLVGFEVPYSPSVFSCIGVVAFAFTCQMNAFPIYEELKNSTELRMNLVGVLSTVGSGIIYFLFVNLGFYSQGSATQTNIMLGYHPGDVAANVGKGLLIVKMITTYPIMLHALLASVIDVTRLKNTYLCRAIVAALFVTGSSLIGYFFTDISYIFSLTGAVADSFISFLFPGILGILCLSKIKQRPNACEGILFSVMLILVSILVTTLTIIGLQS
jgi:amino acid permease